jgi:hypothetical protein
MEIEFRIEEFEDASQLMRILVQSGYFATMIADRKTNGKLDGYRIVVEFSS